MVVAAVREFFVKSGIETGRICVAASGGIDSTALLLALAELRDEGFEVVAAHVNHHLRAVDSDGDEAFVRELCATLQIELHVADGTLDDERVRARGVEAAAREVRYEALQRIRAATATRYLATAHQKDDQAETVLMRLLTGSGIAGLRGIHPIRDDGVIRPLLDVTRAEIEAFLTERGVTPRVDRSNDDARFLRNRVRAIVRELGAVENLSSIAEQARAQWPLLERAIDEAERGHARVSEHETRFASLPDDAWLRGALLQRHIRRLDRDARDFDAMRIADEIASLKRTSVTKHVELLREGDAIVLRRIAHRAPLDFDLPLSPGHPAHIGALGVTMHVSQPPTANRQHIQLPRGADPHFKVRARRAGDRFHPLGAPGSKKLKDFLIDRKIAADLRDRLPLLVWNEEIVWVAGVEVSERFKVSTLQGDLYDVWLEGPDAADSDHFRLQR